jgi:two-component system sensor histidine kinase TctE
MPAPGAEATVRVAAADDVLLEIADTGKGVAPQQLAAVRKRFSRGDSDKPGAGLGLPIVEEIANFSAAELIVASPPAGGFSVQLRLPIAGIEP